MKIVQIDNYARENRNERLVAENIQNEEDGEAMVRGLCFNNPHRSTDDWYKLVVDDYVLYEFKR